MPAKPLSVDVRHRAGFAYIDLQGEINAFAETPLSAAHQEAAAYNPTAILLNFSAVDYINSTGIALIVGLLSEARRSNQRVLAYGLSAHYVEIFQITRLADFMRIYPDEARALAGVAEVKP